MSDTPLALLSLGVALRSATPLSATLEPVEKMYGCKLLKLLLNITVFYYSVSPSIDKGQAGSKTVRTNRTAIWQIKCRGGKDNFEV